jgi:hypothetical protein
MNYPDTINGCCSNCADTDLMLAKDFAEYSGCEWEDGKWVVTYVDTQAVDAHDAVRFFCTGCGTQHAVPEELL